jgi:pyruvate dehydrogenase E2 component (dihydrolipoamide acetyltransferase)
MAEAILMPKSGISVESCLIGAWKKSVGDTVAIGDVLFDYETDKAAFECESTADGVILDIFYHDGEEVEVLKPVCAVGASGEDVSAIRAESGAEAAPAARPDAAAAAHPQQAGERPAADSADASTAATMAATAAEASAATAAAAAADAQPQSCQAGSDKASPRARNMAERLGLGTANASPSGPGGRVIERDVIALAASIPGAPTPESAQTQPQTQTQSQTQTQTQPQAARGGEGESAPAEPGPAMAGSYSDKKLTKIRSLIAKSMHASLQNTAQLTHHHSFDATEVQAVRKAFKANPNPAIAGVSIGDMILFAISRVLVEFPEMNAHLINGDTTRRFENVNLGVAVDTPRGLMVPTVFGADRKSLIEISVEVKQLAAAARIGGIDPDLLHGGTFTVSNLGPTGVEMFTPILNPPQVGIFGVCGVTTKVRQTETGVKPYQSIGMSLTYDHRAVDGAPASRFAGAVCEKLEQFSLMLDI